MTHMAYVLLADTALVVHALFVLFVLFGSWCVIRWPWMLWIHAPALMWGLFVETTGTVCPLTPLESRLRFMSGEAGYNEDFLSHWVSAMIYPEALTRDVQLVLAALLLIFNVAMYALIWKRNLVTKSFDGHMIGRWQR